MRLILCSAALLALTAFGDARAEVSQTGPVAAVSTEDQIDAYLRSSPALELPDDQEIEALQDERERKVHGEVGVAIGSRGYRDFYARSDMPIGKTGNLSVAVRETRFNGRFGPHERQGVSLGLALGDAARETSTACGWTPDVELAPRDRCDEPRLVRQGGPGLRGRPFH